MAVTPRPETGKGAGLITAVPATPIAENTTSGVTTPEMVTDCAAKFGFNPKDLQEVITGGLMTKAMSGDAKAFEVIRDSIGQKPVEQVELGTMDKTPFEIQIIE